jgi:hypothetical protein
VVFLKSQKQIKQMTATLHPFTSPTSSLGYGVKSSAISKIAVVTNNENTYDLLVIFNNNSENVYRYNFLNDNVAFNWIDLLNDDESRNETSWGSKFNRALKNGDIVIV